MSDNPLFFKKGPGIHLFPSLFPGEGHYVCLIKKPGQTRVSVKEEKVSTLISVDGGVNDSTGPECVKMGADILVAGQYLFGHEDFKERYQRLLK